MVGVVHGLLYGKNRKVCRKLNGLFKRLSKNYRAKGNGCKDVASTVEFCRDKLVEVFAKGTCSRIKGDNAAEALLVANSL